MKLSYIKHMLLGICVLSSCHGIVEEQPDSGMISISTSVSPFEGEIASKSSTDGESWEAGDKFRMKIICPFSGFHQSGETWSGYYNFEFGEQDLLIRSSDYNESQATTYVYTAQNTTSNRVFVVADTRYSRPSNFFYSDQSKLEQFKSSDVLWAQAVRQTGSREVHLNFRHKVAKLDITVDEGSLAQTWPLSDNVLLTLEGMPDIDGGEIVVGDYYADESFEDERYTYRDKASCNYENNGKVLGIEVLQESPTIRSCIARMSGNPLDPGGNNSYVAGIVENNATYTAYRSGARHFLLYVPPCTLDDNATFWLRDGERRYSAKLEHLSFAEGKCYPVRLVLGESGTPEI